MTSCLPYPLVRACAAGRVAGGRCGCSYPCTVLQLMEGAGVGASCVTVLVSTLSHAPGTIPSPHTLPAQPNQQRQGYACDAVNDCLLRFFTMGFTTNLRIPSHRCEQYMADSWVDARLWLMLLLSWQKIAASFVFSTGGVVPGENRTIICVLELVKDGLYCTGTRCINRLRFDMEATLAGAGFRRFQLVLSGVRA